MTIHPARLGSEGGGGAFGGGRGGDIGGGGDDGGGDGGEKASPTETSRTLATSVSTEALPSFAARAAAAVS